MLKITERFASLEDFCKLKKYQPWEFYRTIAKPINFGILFGGTPSTVVNLLKNNNFEEKDCDITIEDLGLQSRVSHFMEKGKDHRMAKYFACAEFFRQKFVETYPGLVERCTREFEFAQKNGYIRTWHGPVRHVPELMLARFDKKTGRVISDDKNGYSSFFSNMQNICGNSPIQSLEAYHAFTMIHEVVANLKDWNMYSTWANAVHDSADFYTFEDELTLVASLVRYCASQEKPPYVGVPLDVDAEAADISTGGYYKHGNVKVNFLPLEEALKDYNTKHNTNHKFTPYCPK
jgi:DNA polymerase I-like protein with 3'-5' exonuclease and polymerase domains